jgi:tetratricopeptide (TPR) repeat protein
MQKGIHSAIHVDKSPWIQRILCGLVCVLVIWIYALIANIVGSTLEWDPNPANANYNLMVQGFHAHQLNLKKDVPPGLLALADPYDPVANSAYRGLPYSLHDMSYYNGKLYLYFSSVPALVLFWPWVSLTGHYLSLRYAIVIFCSLGFLISTGLLHAIWRRHFPEINVGVIMPCILVLGLATGVPIMLQRPGVCEVPISCAYVFTMSTLVAIWQALEKPMQRGRWLAAASFAYGLAVGARPSMLFGSVLLLMPIAQTWQSATWRASRKLIWGLAGATIGPITLIGLGLMLYNYQRFDNILEFGQSYQLVGIPQGTAPSFSLHYFWFNFRVYFLEPVRWIGRFPFVQPAIPPPLPIGHADLESSFGVLSNTPMIWFAFAAFFLMGSVPDEERSTLRWFQVAVAILFGTNALIICCFWGTCVRYQIDFLPVLVLLAVLGLLHTERSVAKRPIRRRAIRWAWGTALALSVCFNLFASFENYAAQRYEHGNMLLSLGRSAEAIADFERALRIAPDFAEAHLNLGNALVVAGRIPDAIDHFRQTLRLRPDLAEAYNNLGNALYLEGQPQAAIAELRQAVRTKPDYVPAHENLGKILTRTGAFPAAIVHYQEALRLDPKNAATHNDLGYAIIQAGRGPEAIAEFEAALRLRPEFADAHLNLGGALFQAGRLAEAQRHFEQALQLDPSLAAARDNLEFLKKSAPGQTLPRPD